MRNTAITQIALVGISIVIIVTYIQPTFQNIRLVQDEIFQYADATAKANEFNALLQQLLARERSFSSADIVALDKFLPQELDQLAIMNDIENVLASNGAEVLDMTAGELLEPNPQVQFEDEFDEAYITANLFLTQEYEVRFTSTYEEFTTILQQLESVAYVLEIAQLNFGIVADSGLQFTAGASQDDIEFNMVLKAYALTPST
jgi:hypothetical protein